MEKELQELNRFIEDLSGRRDDYQQKLGAARQALSELDEKIATVTCDGGDMAKLMSKRLEHQSEVQSLEVALKSLDAASVKRNSKEIRKRADAVIDAGLQKANDLTEQYKVAVNTAKRARQEYLEAVAACGAIQLSAAAIPWAIQTAQDYCSQEKRIVPAIKTADQYHEIAVDSVKQIYQRGKV